MSGKDNNRIASLRDEELEALIARAAASTMNGQDDRALYKRIESRVLNQSLPPQVAQTPRKVLAASDSFMRGIDALIDWLNPQRQSLWRPVFAAACPLALALLKRTVPDDAALVVDGVAAAIEPAPADEVPESPARAAAEARKNLLRF